MSFYSFYLFISVLDAYDLEVLVEDMVDHVVTEFSADPIAKDEMELEYPSLDYLFDHCQRKCQRQGFMLGKNLRRRSKTDPTPVKGDFYCRGKRKKCPFKICILNPKGRDHFMIRKVVNEHNHKMDMALISASVKDVRFEHQLLKSEKDLIFMLYSLGAPRLRLILAKQFPGRIFGGNLLTRMFAKARALDSEGGHFLDRLFQLGEEIKESGGWFEPFFTHTLNGDLRLNGLVIQTKNQRDNVEKFGEYYQIDSTFHVGDTTMKLMAPCGVDSLKSTIFFGFCFIQSEALRFIEPALKSLGLDKKETICMSDGAAAFGNAAAKFEQVHLRCTFHYVKNLETKKLEGMTKTRRKRFLEVAKALIYNIYTVAEFDSLLLKAKDEFAEFKVQSDVFFEIGKLREKLCRSFTYKHFTVGGKATTLVEGMHGVIKSSGQTKEQLRHENLYEAVKQLLNLEERRMNTTCNRLKKLQEDGKEVAQKIEAHVNAEMKAGNSLKDNIEVSPGLWKVNEKTETYQVSIDVLGPGSVRCNCPYFTSFNLPCRHLVLPMLLTKQLRFSFASTESIPSRWRLKNHPLFGSALQDLVPVVPVNVENSAAHVDESIQTLSMYCPASKNKRYTLGNQIAKEVLELAVEDKLKFKVFHRTMANLKRKLSGQIDTMFEPPTKRTAEKHNIDKENHAFAYNKRKL